MDLAVSLIWVLTRGLPRRTPVIGVEVVPSLTRALATDRSPVAAFEYRTRRMKAGIAGFFSHLRLSVGDSRDRERHADRHKP